VVFRRGSISGFSFKDLVFSVQDSWLMSPRN
jgi:hypothetical protein